MSTFVTLGNANQPFSRLLDAVVACADQLPKPIIVQHGHTLFDDPDCEAYPFLDMEQFVEHLQAAEVVIIHAGAGSVLHAIREGKLPIVMPRRAQFGEHVDDHQLEFARELADAGRVIMIESDDELAEVLSRGVLKPVVKKTGDECALLTRVAEILRQCEEHESQP